MADDDSFQNHQWYGVHPLVIKAADYISIVLLIQSIIWNQFEHFSYLTSHVASFCIYG